MNLLIQRIIFSQLWNWSNAAKNYLLNNGTDEQQHYSLNNTFDKD